jgi:hypothetical protein
MQEKRIYTLFRGIRHGHPKGCTVNGVNDFNDLPDFDDDIMIIAVAANPETWLPQILLGIPADEEEIVQGIIPVVLTPQEAYQIGAYLIQSAATVSTFHDELLSKSIEEREEIMCLESSFLDSPFSI